MQPKTSMKSNIRHAFRASSGARWQDPKVLAQIARARTAIAAECSVSSAPEPHMLRLALNEAESLAWQTTYPHLVFPVLAAEKIQQLATWKQHQASVLQSSPMLSLAE